MGVLLSKATGNLTDATATWGVVDSTSYLNAENATESLLTTAYSGTRSSAFTPGAITVEGIAVKLCERIGTTGTMSVSLRNATIGLDDFVTGTEVTINTSDLPSALESDANGGWIYFKFASPVTLLAANNYNVQAKTSTATMVDLWCDGTADNLSRALVTSTEAAPAAGDDIIITKSWTAAATGTDVVITMNSTASTDYGAASTSLVTPAIAICQGGTLRSGVTAATAYILKVSGNIIVYSGGSLELGTTGTPMPRDSSLTVTLDCGANVDFGIIVRNGGAMITQGQSRTSGKNIDRCLLNTDEAVNQTTLGVDTDTGWLDNDVIAIASTSRTAGECESGTLNGAAGASSLTVDGFAGAGGGLAFAHSGTSPTQAEVILLTRNVVITGASTSLNGYVDIKGTATIDCDWTEFKWLGSATSGKEGVLTACSTSTQTFNRCSFHDFTVTGANGFKISSSAVGTGLTFSDNVTYNTASGCFVMGSAATGSITVDNNVFMRTTVSATRGVLFNDVNSTFTNNTMVGAFDYGFLINADSGSTIANISNNTIHSCGGGFWVNATIFGEVGATTVWRNNGAGLQQAVTADVVYNNFTLFGNLTHSIYIIAGYATLNSFVSNGDSTFSTTNGVSISDAIVVLNSCDLSTTGGIKTAHTNDISMGNGGVLNYVNVYLNNTKLGAATEVSTQNLMTPNAFVASQKHDQTTGLHKTFRRYGLITIDTVIYDTTPSIRMAPNNASFELNQTIGRVNVNSGQAATPSVKVRESVVGDGTDYNGNRIKLYVRRNDAIGITSDTLLDTASASSEGAFETLSAATAAASEDGVMEFYVTCDGTTGWTNIDTLTVTVA